MKKLLSLLTITTLTASVPAPLLANTILVEKVKINVGTSKSNNDYLPIKEISSLGHNVISLAVDSSNNIYFGTSNGAYVLKHGATTPTKIDGINGSVDSIVINYKKNIIYFVVNNDIYYLNSENNKLNKLTVIPPTAPFVINRISVNENNELIIGVKERAFVLKHGATTPTKIDGIDEYMTSFTLSSNGNIYIGTKKGAFILQTALSWTKQQSQFTLVDSTKTQTWTRPDLLSVDGELNIDIANPNIDKVVFDNVEQPQTNKHWTINVKPETAPRDHNLQVMFTLDGKQYTSEIIVSMQAKIDPTPTPVQQNLSDLIKTTDLGNIIDNNQWYYFHCC